MELTSYGATQEVTGSLHLVQSGPYRLLLDCGLWQGGKRSERRNFEPFSFDPRSIDAVVLSHAHLDHSGRLPLLVKQGFQGPIVGHPATLDLCRILLKDAAHLQVKDAEWENKKRRRKGLPEIAPLYDSQDVEPTLRLFTPLQYGVEHPLLSGVIVRLQDAGHILGSSVVELFLQEHGAQRKIVFSGDLGHFDAPILRDPTTITEADLVLMESTYGDRRHRPWQATLDELGEVFANASSEKGNILIPTFAIGRAQELLYLMQEHALEWGLQDWSIFLDSPMAVEATEVYTHYWREYDQAAQAERREGGSLLHMPNLHYVRDTKDSMGLNQVRSGAIILAGSGMCTGGRILQHFKHHLWRSGTHVLIVGYQAEGSLGRKLVDGARHIRLWGEAIRVAAKVHTIGGLSAHADQDGLIRWYRGFRDRPPVYLVHGEAQGQDGLQARLEQEDGVQGHILKNGEKVDMLA